VFCFIVAASKPLMGWPTLNSMGLMKLMCNTVQPNQWTTEPCCPLDSDADGVTGTSQLKADGSGKPKRGFTVQDPTVANEAAASFTEATVKNSFKPPYKQDLPYKTTEFHPEIDDFEPEKFPDFREYAFDELQEEAGADKMREMLTQDYKEVFEGIGCFPGEYNIDLKPDAIPHIAGARRIPYGQKEQFKKTLDQMVQDKIIEKIAPDDGTEWVNSFVTVAKPDGTLRICVDPRMLNKYIVRPVHRSRTLDEILPKLAGAKVFTIMDATKGFWNVRLNWLSSRLCAFSTEFGRYRYLRLPFGLSCASDIFQAKIDELTDGLEGCIGIADDLVVYSNTMEEHETRLKALMEKCKSSGLKLNPRKCKICLPEIPFYGLIVGKEGTNADPKKLEALKALPMPTNLKELQSFLGLVNYLARFSPVIADVAKPLRDLTKKTGIDTSWIWQPEHSLAINTLKNLFDSAVLQYFNPMEEVFVEADASLVGLGGCLLQQDPSITCPADDEYFNLRPVAFASKSLTETEQRYSNIERELLSVVYSLERFHCYTYAQKVHVLTDHKPLEAIFKKDLQSAPPRLQRLIYRSERYDFTVEYRKGIKQLISDILSRQGHHIHRDPPFRGLNYKISQVNVDVDTSTLEDIRRETSQDPRMQKLVEYIISGWPEDLMPELTVYKTFRDQLAVSNGIIQKGERVLIPEALRESCLALAHASHLGYEKTLMYAKTTVFWPNMASDVRKLCEECVICAKWGNKKKELPLKPTEVPPSPWHTLGMDNFTVQGCDYLLIVDYLTKYPIIRKSGHSARETIRICKEVFAENGIPTKVIADRGTNFTAEEFQEFARSWQFQMIYTSAEHHRANGEAERFVQTLKKLITKVSEGNGDLQLALLQLRCTPLSRELGGDDILSPASLMYGRTLKTTMPSIKDLLDSKVTDHTREQQVAEKQSWAGKQDLDPDQLFQIGAKVWYYVEQGNQKHWSEAFVVGRRGRSYTLQIPSGRYIHRNHYMVKLYKSTKDIQRAQEKDKAEQPGVISVQIPHAVKSPDSTAVKNPVTVQKELNPTVSQGPARETPAVQSTPTVQPDAVPGMQILQGNAPKRLRGRPPKVPPRAVGQPPLQAVQAAQGHPEGQAIEPRRSTRKTQQPDRYKPT
jgi:hypothetical protein